MAKKNQEQEKAETPSLTFKHEGKTYEFIIKKFMIGREEMTAEEALKDAELLSELVAIGSGVITIID